MKKVTVFLGSPRKQATYRALQEFEQSLNAMGAFDVEYVFLKEHSLENCLGCKLCFDKGEEHCPLKDDRDLLLNKIEHSDGVIFASPNYSYQVTALLKNFIERISFLFHRPRFFDKAFTVIVTQGIYGGAAIEKYLRQTGMNMGFHAAKGCCLTTLEPGTPRQQQAAARKLEKAAARFYKELMRPSPPAPSLLRLMMFRTGRTAIQLMLNEGWRDYRYYNEKGWFHSGYYHPVRLGPGKRLAGRLFDQLGKRMVKSR